MERSIATLARMDGFMIPVVTYPTDADIRGGRQQKRYIKTFAKYVRGNRSNLRAPLFVYQDMGTGGSGYLLSVQFSFIDGKGIF